MQSLDWKRLVANDPNLEHPSANDPYLAYTEEFHQWPYVRTKGSDLENQIEGYAHTDQSAIVFLDLLDDGQQEAVIPLDDTGNNFYGYEGVLIYGMKNGVVALIGTLPAHKTKAFEVRADGNEIVFREPIFQGSESLCCPSGWTDTWYRLEDTRLVAVKNAWSLDASARLSEVEDFYSSMASRGYREFYIRDFYNKYLSSAFRATHSFDEWHAEYQDTISMDLRAWELADGSIAIDLLKTDATDKGIVTQRLVGKWTLVATERGWVLDSFQTESVP